MRTARLAGIAAKAERLRLRRLVRRLVVRAALGAVAAVFALLGLVAIHFAIAIELAHCMPAIYAVLWVLAGDVVLAVFFAVLALWVMARPGRAEREARLVRDQALLPIYDLVSLGRVAVRVEQRWLRAALSLLLFLTRRWAK